MLDLDGDREFYPDISGNHEERPKEMTHKDAAQLTKDSAAIAYAKVMGESVQVAIEEYLHVSNFPSEELIAAAVVDVVRFGPTGALNQAIWVWSIMALEDIETQAEISAAFGDMLQASITNTFIGNQVTGPFCKIG